MQKERHNERNTEINKGAQKHKVRNGYIYIYREREREIGREREREREKE